MLKLDHIAIGAADLEQGAAEISDLLGAGSIGGGKHPKMGTHNALWRLETSSFPVYLEVITIDPEAEIPDIPRWFGLDDPEVQARIAGGPKLLTFVANTADIEHARTGMPTDPGAPLEVTRGDLKWLFTLPADGGLVAGGALPYLIQWPEGVQPVSDMPEQNIELINVAGARLHELDIVWPCPTNTSSAALTIDLRTARGETVLL